MRMRTLLSIVLNALLSILFNLALVSAKGGGAGGGGGGGAGGAGTGGGRSGSGGTVGATSGGSSFTRSPGAIAGVVIGVIVILIIIIIIVVWHMSMVKAQKRMEAAQMGTCKPVETKAATRTVADLEAAQPIFKDVDPSSVAAEQDAASLGKKKKKHSLWVWK